MFSVSNSNSLIGISAMECVEQDTDEIIGDIRSEDDDLYEDINETFEDHEASNTEDEYLPSKLNDPIASLLPEYEIIDKQPTPIQQPKSLYEIFKYTMFYFSFHNYI